MLVDLNRSLGNRHYSHEYIENRHSEIVEEIVNESREKWYFYLDSAIFTFIRKLNIMNSEGRKEFRF